MRMPEVRHTNYFEVFEGFVVWRLVYYHYYEKKSIILVSRRHFDDKLSSHNQGFSRYLGTCTGCLPQRKRKSFIGTLVQWKPIYFFGLFILLHLVTDMILYFIRRVNKHPIQYFDKMKSY